MKFGYGVRKGMYSYSFQPIRLDGVHIAISIVKVNIISIFA
jgi:hypothetical protein